MSSTDTFSQKPVLDDVNWRFEYKYHLSMPKYLAVKYAIHRHMYLDEYTLAAPDNKYLVRSLYFDSLFFNSFHEKIDGNRDRLKLRIRTYVEKPEQINILKAEIKVRKNVITEKYVAPIGYQDYLDFMSFKHWQGDLLQNKTLSEFERYFHLKNQVPVVLIQYEREGYRSRDNNDIRITFDHHTRSTKSDVLFPDLPIFKEHYPNLIILEIKCNKQQPDWLHQMVKDHGLTIVSNSKYVQGVMCSHPSVVTPSWSS